MSIAWLADTSRRELVHTLRSLRHAPAYLIGVTASLALAIAATVTAFAVTYDLVLRPPPWRNPDEIVLVHRLDPGSGEISRTWSVPRFQDLRRAVAGQVEAASFAARAVTLSLANADTGLRTHAEFASADYMMLVGVRPARGRLLDSSSAGQSVVVLSDALARRLFPAVSAIGATVRVNGIPLVVIGTMPEQFAGMSGRSALWIPWTAAPAVWASPNALSQFAWSFEVALRVPGDWSAERRGVLLDHLSAAAAPSGPMVAAGQAPTTPGVASRARTNLSLVRAWDQLVEPRARQLVWVLFGAAACVLLLACTNVASLFAVRLSTRWTEIAVRRAIGASTSRLVGSSLLEATFIALLSAAAGLALAAVAKPLLWRIQPFASDSRALPGEAAVSVLQWQSLTFTGLVTLIVVALIGLWPALEVSGGARNPTLDLRSRLTRRGSRRTKRLHTALSAAQLGAAFVLSSAAVLFTVSLRSLTKLDHGFSASRLVSARIDLPRTRYDSVRARGLYERLIQEVERTPGVLHVAIANVAPLDASGITTAGAIEFALPIGAGGRGTSFEYHTVSDDYFRTLGAAVSGSWSGERGAGDAVPVLVNRAAVRRYWRDVNPVGRTISEFHLANLAGRWTRGVIVGVAPDIQYGRPGATVEPALYVRAADDPPLRALVLVRTSGDPRGIVPALRSALRLADPQLVLHGTKAMSARVRDVSSATRFGMFVLGAYAAVAVIIALVGVYAVMTFGAAQRRGEFALRLALGATPRAVLTDVLGRGLRLCAIGLAVGLAGSLSAQQLLRAHLFGVSAADPRYLALVFAVLAAAGVCASLFPAVAATRLDPAAVLKSEG